MGCYYTPQVCCVTAQQAAYFIIVTLHGSLSKLCIDTAKCGCNLEERKQSTTNCGGKNKKYARFLVKNPAQGGRVLRALPQLVNLSCANEENVLSYPQGAGYPVVGCYYTPQACCVPAQ